MSGAVTMVNSPEIRLMLVGRCPEIVNSTRSARFPKDLGIAVTGLAREARAPGVKSLRDLTPRVAPAREPSKGVEW
jgi:hypothetical protein